MMRLLMLALCCIDLLASENREPSRTTVAPENIILRLVRLVQWPEAGRPAGPLRVCVAGSDSVEAEVIAGLDGQVAASAPFHLRRVSTIAEMRACHVLFIGQSLRGQWRDIQAALDRFPVLSIAAFPGFSLSGGIVELSLLQNRPFIINAGAAKRNGFSFHPSLITIAEVARSAESME
jgi:hypothetical protein